MTAFVIPRHLRERQHAASDPQRSIWVSANAGSGKTHVLTQRVIRLLLAGVAPSKILCLTFTKAAAAQMATRVFDTLAGWTALDDDWLRAAIVETGAANPAPADLLLARRLFTRAIETPGGLKIQTIHAFCERLLHLFPFEANVPARFEVADEKRAEEMLSLARRAAIAEARRASDESGAALALVADLAGAMGINALVATAMRLRAAGRGAPDLQKTLPSRLGAGTLISVEAVQRAMIMEGIAPSRWQEIALVFEEGASNDRKQADRLRQAAAADTGRDDPTRLSQTLAFYLPVFFTDGGEKRKGLITNKLGTSYQALAAELQAEQARLETLRAKLKIAEAIDRTQALLLLADAICKRYEHAKMAQGVLDFDDLIERTRSLLDRSDSGWVLHKLDAGIDHVLVDEAQDTSEAQWRILERLTGDFASGRGSRGQQRSFFVVGDDKQSIFSFQGAAPLMFDTMRGDFERRFRAGRKPFERVSLNTSFRSVAGILDAVDALFDRQAHQDGLVQGTDAWPKHESIKGKLPSLVEIWPRLGAVAPDESAEWTIPIDMPSERDPPSIVADRVARQCKRLVAADSREFVHGKDGARRRITPGDILILVRTRNAFFEAVIRALKRHHVHVAGADRLDIANHIAVMDLCAAGRAALLPQDDLSLACVLKSPLFGLADDDLIMLAPPRRGALFDALAGSAVERHRAAHATIRRWSKRVSAVTPFDFYIELLGRDGGRRLMEERLGPEAQDAIDEFLRLALAHEQQGAPSLGAFVADVEALESSIKRDMEGGADAVRVMTVHAAKGLEAKIVFLPDTCAVPSQRFDPTVFDLNKDSGLSPVLVWSPRMTDDPAIVAAARAAERLAAMREYRRLLYVALTRAEERLYIAGFYNTKAPPDDCWSAMIENAFPDAEEAPAFWDEADVVRRITTSDDGEPGTQPKPADDQHSLGLCPDWLTCPVAATRSAGPLRPSRLQNEVASGTERREGMAYGSALHLLLQHLPTVEPPRREDAGRAFLRARPGLLDAGKHDEILTEALAVLAMPALALLFGASARAEVAVIGQVARGDGGWLPVRGTIDRLVATSEALIIADFKSGTPQTEVPERYGAQLALYAEVLAPLWPKLPLKVLLVWTATPRVVELDGGWRKPAG